MATKSFITIGFQNIDVDIECSLTNGLPSITIVGLASKTIDEAKERLRAAITNSGYRFPRKRIVINLAPADIPKDSASLDLALAIALLQADGQINADLSDIYFIGELALDGNLRPVRGIVGKLMGSARASLVVIPCKNTSQAALVGSASTPVLAANSLQEVVEYLNNTKPLTPIKPLVAKPITSKSPDFAEIYGQENAKRALLVAAAGGHNVLLSGPPGTGKSMLAKAFIGILPPLNTRQSMESTHIHSLIGVKFDEIISLPPLRSPHHTSSDVALMGGGHVLRPGEISLAHNGVLFLDEMPEFNRRAIESLRQPLEDGVITIARAQQSSQLPARFILIATCNPCPCGYLFSSKPCICTAYQIQKYQKKLSGPIIDRIDIHVTVGAIDHKNILKTSAERHNRTMQQAVSFARLAQQKRQREKLNAVLTNRELKKYANLNKTAETLLERAAQSLDLSPRSYIRTIKVARTIADLDKSIDITEKHVAEALQYRPKQTNV